MVKKSLIFFVLFLVTTALLFIGVFIFDVTKPKALVFEDKSDRIQYGQQVRLRYSIEGFNTLLIGKNSYKIKPDVLYEHDLLGLNTFGLKRVFASVINNEADYKHKKTDILLLPGSLKQSNLSYKEGLFFTSKYTHPSFYEVLNKPVSRFQFAFVLSTFRANTKACYSRFSDLDEWQHKIACQALKEEWVLHLKNNAFYPKESISMMQFVIALVNVLKLPLPKTHSDTLNELNPFHWSYPYVVAAYQYGLIDSKDNFDLQAAVSQKQLAYAFELIHTKQNLAGELAMKAELLDTKKSHVFARQRLVNQTREPHQKGPFDVAFEIKPAVVSTLNYPLKGRVIALNKEADDPFHFEGELLYVNGTPIKLNQEGVFELPVSLKKGKNTFRLRFWHQSEEIAYWYEPIPAMFRAHWFEKESHRLYALGFLKERDFLVPNHSLTRGQFAELMVMLLDLEPKEQEGQSFRDLKETHPYYWAIQTLVSHGILKGAGDLFMPDKRLSNIEALIGIFRAIDQSEAPVADSKDQFILPFQDISRVPWAASYIRQAYQQKLISKAPYFYPKKSVNVAECLAMLYRSEFMSQAILKRLEG